MVETTIVDRMSKTLLTYLPKEILLTRQQLAVFSALRTIFRFASGSLLTISLLGSGCGMVAYEDIDSEQTHAQLHGHKTETSNEHNKEMEHNHHNHKVGSSSNHGEGMGHNHGTMEIPSGQPVPDVDIVVYSDPMTGWNLEIKVSNFQFSPKNASKAHQSGEGHGHLFINGQKITRIYSNWYYIGKLEPGRNEITVTLNSNNHQDLVHNGDMISDTEIIEVMSN
ncbi:hypothetical protein BJP36_32220 [Moorena producens JHB]|uniref:Uncharacterized protein n=1 Tax=Moorena producens (strain JHB) TaxID=1454205 RepID=A0A1D9G8D9_MOOP1|nr:hypothetical protein [Moorena producens]AOY83897.1 hypothetical protein BJP36_32220 [Moorena producens JHB]